MPHADLKYSSDLEIDAKALFEDIETAMQAHDVDTGLCKCRAYPTDVYRYTHCLLEARMFAKRERDAAFTARLVKALEEVVKRHIRQECFLSVMLTFSPTAYLTRQYRPLADA